MTKRGARDEGRSGRPAAKKDPNNPELEQSAAAPRKTPARAERVPLGVPRSKLTVPNRPGYVRRWINDDGKGRLQFAQQGGYAFVEDPDLRIGEDEGQSRQDSRVSRIVGRTAQGGPMRAYLMEISSELYQQDQKSKQSALDEVDRAIRKGRLVSDGEQHRYVPEKGRAIGLKDELVKGKPPGEDAETD